MACKRPLKGFQIGLTKNGKPQYKITSFEVDYVYSLIDNDNPVWHEARGASGYHPGWKVVDKFIQIPCGQCIGCRLAYSRFWADRCVFESKYHEENYFITLTYNDENLVKSYMFDSFNNVEYVTPTLYMRDLQLFFKRLRKKAGSFRYYACGEYGSQTMRPHYHICAFGLHLDDLKFKKKSFDGHDYFISELLEETWGKGFVIITPFCWETAAYTARYTAKKINNDLSAFYDSFNIEKEFVLMSRRPGIGHQYYLDNLEEIYDDDRVYLPTNKGVQEHKPPRYFDKLFEQDFPEEFASLKENRKELAEELMQRKLETTSLDYGHLLKVEEQQLLAKNKKLVRKEI